LHNVVIASHDHDLMVVFTSDVAIARQHEHFRVLQHAAVWASCTYNQW